MPPCFDYCVSTEVLSKPGAWNTNKTSRIFALLEAIAKKNFVCLEQLFDRAGCEVTPLALCWAIGSDNADDVLYADIVRFVYEAVNEDVEERQRYFTDAFIYGTTDVLTILMSGWGDCSDYLQIVIPNYYGSRGISAHRDPAETALSVRWLIQQGFRFADGDTTFLSRALQIGSMELVRLARSEDKSWYGDDKSGRDGFVRAAFEGRLEHLKECYTDHDAAGAMFGFQRGLDMAMGAAEGGFVDTLAWILEKMQDSPPDMGQIATAAASGGSVSVMQMVFSPGLGNLAQVAGAAVGHLGVLKFLQSKGVELGELLVQDDALIQSLVEYNAEVFFFLSNQFSADSICNTDLLKEAVQSGLYGVVERILSSCPELIVDIQLIESAVSPEPGLVKSAGEQGCFFEIAVLLYTRVDREAWVGKNNVCLLAEEAGNFAVVRWAVEMGCYRNVSSRGV